MVLYFAILPKELRCEILSLIPFSYAASYTFLLNIVKSLDDFISLYEDEKFWELVYYRQISRQAPKYNATCRSSYLQILYDFESLSLETQLYNAIANNRDLYAAQLIHSGVRIKYTEYQESLLFTINEYNNSQLLEILISHGMYGTIETAYSIMHRAITDGRLFIVKCLIERHPLSIDFSKPPISSQCTYITPLRKAIKYKQKHIIKYLLDNGYSMDSLSHEEMLRLESIMTS